MSRFFALLRPYLHLGAQTVLPLLLAVEVLSAVGSPWIVLLSTSAFVLAFCGYLTLLGRAAPRWMLAAPAIAVLSVVTAIFLSLGEGNVSFGDTEDVLAAVLPLALTVPFAAVSIRAIRARSRMPSPSLVLRPPLEPGRYLVLQGGPDVLLNSHRLAAKVASARGQSFGVDLIKLDSWGNTARRFASRRPSDYEIFGAEVVAPADGQVRSFVSNMPDHELPDSDPEYPMGNHIWLDIEGPDGPLSVLLAHLQQDSVLVSQDEWVKAGQPLARVGNSGNTSEPHLHVHAQVRKFIGRPMGAPAVPFQIEGSGVPYRNQILRVEA